VSDLTHWLATDILSLGMAANDARRSVAAGSLVTYLRVHTLAPGDLAACTRIPDEASEVRLYPTPANRDEAVAQVRRLRELAGARRVAAFSMADLERRASADWGDVLEIVKALVAAGLSDVAELPVDQLDDLTRSMQTLVDAGVGPRRVTVSQPVGGRKLEILDRVARCAKQAGPVRYFSPLPRQAPVDKPTTGYEDLRMVALARLALNEASSNELRTSIEVDWSLYGPKLAQVALTFGADHLDAVLATSDSALGPRRATVADVERNIRAAGFEPREHRPAL
jgi:hypothetical protein